MRSTPDAAKALDANGARKRISLLLRSGQLTYTRHSREEMEKDDLTEVDVTNVLRGGHITEPAENEKGPGGTGSTPTPSGWWWHSGARRSWSS